MKVILINPKPKIWIKSATIPIGIAYIAGFIKSRGYDVSVVDLNLNPDAELPEADVYGITATTPLIYSAFELAERLKKQGAYIVLGGPHPTCLPDESLSQSCIDYVVRGEGEYTFYELLEAIKNKSSLEGIKGLSYKENNKICHNPPREFIKNLDELPFPAFELFGDLKKYSHPQPLIGWRKPVVNIMTSRGCPFNCHFCYKGTFGTKWRARSPENVVAELEMLINKFKVKEIGIQDDCFNLDINRAINIGKLIIKKKLNIPLTFPNGLRADYINEEFVEIFKEAGMYRTAIGVESGDQAVLDDLGKNEKLEDIENAVRILKKHKIQIITFFVMGNPKDTLESLDKSIEFAKKLAPEFSQFSMATPFPGTRLYETVKSYNTFRILNWNDYSQFDQKGYFDYPELKGAVIASYVKKAYRSFYFRPVQLFRLMSLKDFYMTIPNKLSAMIHFGFKGR